MVNSFSPQKPLCFTPLASRPKRSAPFQIHLSSPPLPLPACPLTLKLIICPASSGYPSSPHGSSSPPLAPPSTCSPPSVTFYPKFYLPLWGPFLNRSPLLRMFLQSACPIRPRPFPVCSSPQFFFSVNSVLLFYIHITFLYHDAPPHFSPPPIHKWLQKGVRWSRRSALLII